MNNNKGFSLIEIMIGVSILAVNLLASKHLQSIANKSKVQDENLRAIAETGREIEKMLTSPKACSDNFKGKNPNSLINDLSLDDKIISKAVSNTVRIDKYEIINGADGKNYLQVTFANAQLPGGNSALFSAQRRYLINAPVDASGNFSDCNSTENIENKELITENLVCQNLSGEMNPNAKCDVFKRDLEATPPEGLNRAARGGSFKIVYENGQQKIEAKPCTLKKRLIDNHPMSGCHKGKDVNIDDFVENYDDGKVETKGTAGIIGVRWINVCVYRSYCEEDPEGPTFGKTYFKVGKMKGGFGNDKNDDAGSKNGCERTKLPCDGAELTGATASGLTYTQSITAKQSYELTRTYVNDIKKFINAGNLNEAYGIFGDLKKAADKAERSSYLAQQSSQVNPNNETKKAAKEAKEFSDLAWKEFEKGGKILEKNGAFRGLSYSDTGMDAK